MAYGLETLRHAKNIAAALGVGGVVYSAYTVSGLPVPATVFQVDQRIENVRSAIHSLNGEMIETQRAVMALRRSALRGEKYTLMRTITTADTVAKAALTRRMGEIEDEIADIEKKDDDLLKRSQAIRNGARAPAT